MADEHKIEEHLARTLAQVDSSSGLVGLIVHNLSNFAHRYLSTTATPAPVVEQSAPGVFITQSVEADLIAGLKLGDSEIRPHLIEMAKRVGKGATIGQRLTVEIGDPDPKRAFKAVIKAGISWGHPDHSFKQDYLEKSITVDYEDALDMRNRLALGLEEVSAFF